MSNTQADRLAEQIKGKLADAMFRASRGAEFNDAERAFDAAVDALAALAKQQASPPSAPQCEQAARAALEDFKGAATERGCKADAPGTADTYAAPPNHWTPEDRAAIWFHIPDQFRDDLNGQSAGDVAMAVLRLQTAYAEAIEATQVREQAALPTYAHEALTLAREYVVNASQRAYDGANGQAIREEAKRRLALIDASIAQGTTPAAGAGEQAQAEQMSEEQAVVSIFKDGRIFIRGTLPIECANHLSQATNIILVEAGIKEKTNV